MATVKIGDRVLEVRRATLGFYRDCVLPWQEEAEGLTKPREFVDHAVAGLLLYLGHNEGVTREWLLDNVPMDPRPLIAACSKAAGFDEPSPGEAQSP